MSEKNFEVKIMKNNHILKREVINQIAQDSVNIPLFVLSNIRAEVVALLKKYALVCDENVELSVKILKGKKYIIHFDCLCDDIYLC